MCRYVLIDNQWVFRTDTDLFLLKVTKSGSVVAAHSYGGLAEEQMGGIAIGKCAYYYL
jgi:hypothetical protein